MVSLQLYCSPWHEPKHSRESARERRPQPLAACLHAHRNSKAGDRSEISKIGAHSPPHEAKAVSNQTRKINPSPSPQRPCHRAHERRFLSIAAPLRSALFATREPKAVGNQRRK